MRHSLSTKVGTNFADKRRSLGLHCGISLLSKRDHWGDQDVDGWIILKWILDSVRLSDWIDLDQDRDQWRALVNTVMNIRLS
jgi:hypothetical protein